MSIANQSVSNWEVESAACSEGGGDAADYELEIAPQICRQSRAAEESSGTICQVGGCGKDLSEQKNYFQRYRCCELHLKSLSILVDGKPSRFCQQCGRFQELHEFDGDRRSCRAKLQSHNLRRRSVAETRMEASSHPRKAAAKRTNPGGSASESREGGSRQLNSKQAKKAGDVAALQQESGRCASPAFSKGGREASRGAHRCLEDVPEDDVMFPTTPEPSTAFTTSLSQPPPSCTSLPGSSDRLGILPVGESDMMRVLTRGSLGGSMSTGSPLLLAPDRQHPSDRLALMGMQHTGRSLGGDGWPSGLGQETSTARSAGRASLSLSMSDKLTLGQLAGDTRYGLDTRTKLEQLQLLSGGASELSSLMAGNLHAAAARMGAADSTPAKQRMTDTQGMLPSAAFLDTAWGATMGCIGGGGKLLLGDSRLKESANSDCWRAADSSCRSVGVGAREALDPQCFGMARLLLSDVEKHGNGTGMYGSGVPSAGEVWESMEWAGGANILNVGPPLMQDPSWSLRGSCPGWGPGPVPGAAVSFDLQTSVPPDVYQLNRSRLVRNTPNPYIEFSPGQGFGAEGWGRQGQGMPLPPLGMQGGAFPLAGAAADVDLPTPTPDCFPSQLNILTQMRPMSLF